MNMLSNRLNKHFVAAAAVAVVGAQAATAAVVYSGIVNINVPATTAGVYLNLETGVNNSSPAAVPGWDINPWGSTNLSFFTTAGTSYVRYSASSALAAGNLDVGQMIDGSSVYGLGNTGTVFSAAAGEWHVNSDNLVGFQFAGASGVRFGWARVAVGATPTVRSIVDYAYEDTGAGISAGVVPAPGSLALAGLAGLAAARRRRA